MRSHNLEQFAGLTPNNRLNLFSFVFMVTLPPRDGTNTAANVTNVAAATCGFISPTTIVARDP
jgi:hypothetical protein